jgi:hypothetical protein
MLSSMVRRAAWLISQLHAAYLCAQMELITHAFYMCHALHLRIRRCDAVQYETCHRRVNDSRGGISCARFAANLHAVQALLWLLDIPMPGAKLRAKRLHLELPHLFFFGCSHRSMCAKRKRMRRAVDAPLILFFFASSDRRRAHASSSSWPSSSEAASNALPCGRR